MNRQHIIRAVFPKGDMVFIFYDVISRQYSGHFFPGKTLSKISTLKTIEEVFPATFDEIGDHALKLHNRGIKIDFKYLQGDAGRTYTFFEHLKKLK